MRHRLLGLAGLGATLVVMMLGGRGTRAQQAQPPAAPPRNASPANMPLATLEDLFIRFPLPPGQDVYADIDGRHMHRDVVEQADIARKYRPPDIRSSGGASSVLPPTPRTPSG